MTETKTIILDNLSLHFTCSLTSSSATASNEIKSMGGIVELVNFSGTIKVSTTGRNKKDDSAGALRLEQSAFNPRRIKAEMKKSLMSSTIESLKRPKDVRSMKTPLVSSINIKIKRDMHLFY